MFSFFRNKEPEIPLGKVMLYSVPWDYSVVVSIGPFVESYNIIGQAIEASDMKTTRINITEEYITPEVLLLLKYFTDGNILSYDTRLSAQDVNALSKLLSIGNVIPPDFTQSAQYLSIPFLGNPQFLLIQRSHNPRISSTITIRSIPDNYSVTVSGPKLAVAVDGTCGLLEYILELAPGVSVIEFDILYITSETLRAIYYLFESKSTEQYRIASRYFLIDELSDPIVQEYVNCVDSIPPTGPTITLRSVPWNVEVNLSRNNLLQLFPDSMPARVLELDSKATVIPIENPRITEGALQAIAILVNRPLQIDPDFIESARYLGLPGLTNPFLSEVAKCITRI